MSYLDTSHAGTTPVTEPVAGPLARLILGIAGGLCALSAVFGLLVGVAPGLFDIEGPLWMFAGFEMVVLTSAVFAVLIAMGAQRRGQAITAACLAFAVAVSSVLQLAITNSELGGVGLTPFALGRLGVACLFAASACFIAVTSRRALLRLVMGIVVASPIVVLVAPIASKRVGISLPDLGGPLSTVLSTLGPAASLSAWLVGGLLGIIAIALSGHLLITAFDVPAEEAGEKSAASKSE